MQDSIQPYALTHMDVEVQPNQLKEHVTSINNTGGINVTDYGIDVHRFSTKCLPPATQVPGSSKCVCPGGMTYSSTYGCLSYCPDYQTWDGSSNHCVNICTDPNTFYDAFSGACRPCPVGYQTDSTGVCVPLLACPDGQSYMDNTGICMSCPEGQTLGGDNLCMEACLEFQIFEAASQNCVNKCAPNQYYDITSSQCIKCPPGYQVNDQNQCSLAPQCPEGQVLDANNLHCVSQCLFYETYDTSSTTCVPSCHGTNPQGFAFQYYDTITGLCAACPNGQMSDGSNGCIPIPSTPGPTCQPGHVYRHGECVKDCGVWRYYDANTDSCLLQCTDRTTYWNTDINGCAKCPVGFMTNGNNKCVNPVPTVPVINTVAPTCGPGYNATDKGCTSFCPAFLYNNPDDPLDCIPYCTLNWQTYNTATKSCENCPMGSLKDDSTATGLNMCTACMPGYKKNPAPQSSVNKSQCIPESCPQGYLVSTDTTDPCYNTCSVCDTNNIEKVPLILGWQDLRGDGVCVVSGCVTGYAVNPSANNCSNCADGYTKSPDGIHCQPKNCPAGYLPGTPDSMGVVTCNACDTNNSVGTLHATGYTMNPVTGVCEVQCSTSGSGIGVKMFQKDSTGNCKPVCDNANGYAADANGGCTACLSGYHQKGDGTCEKDCVASSSPNISTCTATCGGSQSSNMTTPYQVGDNWYVDIKGTEQVNNVNVQCQTSVSYQDCTKTKCYVYPSQYYPEVDGTTCSATCDDPNVITATGTIDVTTYDFWNGAQHSTKPCSISCANAAAISGFSFNSMDVVNGQYVLSFTVSATGFSKLDILLNGSSVLTGVIGPSLRSTYTNNNLTTQSLSQFTGSYVLTLYDVKNAVSVTQTITLTDQTVDNSTIVPNYAYRVDYTVIGAGGGGGAGGATGRNYRYAAGGGGGGAGQIVKNTVYTKAVKHDWAGVTMTVGTGGSGGYGIAGSDSSKWLGGGGGDGGSSVLTIPSFDGLSVNAAGGGGGGGGGSCADGGCLGGGGGGYPGGSGGTCCGGGITSGGNNGSGYGAGGTGSGGASIGDSANGDPGQNGFISVTIHYIGMSESDVVRV